MADLRINIHAFAYHILRDIGTSMISKAEQVESGFYGKEPDDTKWAKDLRSAADKLLNNQYASITPEEIDEIESCSEYLCEAVAISLRQLHEPPKVAKNTVAKVMALSKYEMRQLRELAKHLRGIDASTPAQDRALSKAIRRLENNQAMASSCSVHNDHTSRQTAAKCESLRARAGYQYTLAEIRNGTGFPRKARFVRVDGLQTYTLDKSDITTILVALRAFQRQFEDCAGRVIAQAFPDYFDLFDDDTVSPEPLSSEDIDDLCEKLNFGRVEIIDGRDDVRN